MGRPRLHSFPADEMLRRIAGVIQARREALQAELDAAQADQAAEREAAAANEAARIASGLDYAQWARLRPQPPRGDGWHREYHAKRALADLANGIPYDLEAFTGRNDLTPSARIAAQKSIRQLEAEGLVKIEGMRAVSINITPAGLLALEAAHA